jgi:hypothetical protein
MSAEHGKRPIIAGETHYLVARGDKKPIIGVFGARNPDKGQLTAESTAQAPFPVGNVPISGESGAFQYTNHPDGFIVIREDGRAVLKLVYGDKITEHIELTENWFKEKKQLRDKVKLVER